MRFGRERRRHPAEHRDGRAMSDRKSYRRARSLIRFSPQSKVDAAKQLVAWERLQRFWIKRSTSQSQAFEHAQRSRAAAGANRVYLDKAIMWLRVGLRHIMLHTDRGKLRVR
jgi:hypothetical protein